jgi:hypothetical protein
MVKHRVFNNVGAVKRFLSVLVRALRRVRHFALVEAFAVPNQGSLVINSRIAAAQRARWAKIRAKKK